MESVENAGLKHLNWKISNFKQRTFNQSSFAVTEQETKQVISCSDFFL